MSANEGSKATGRKSSRRGDYLRLLILAVGVGLLAFGVASTIAFYNQKGPSTISGSEVMEAAQCSGGYAAGSCPVVSDDWSGTLVSPEPGLADGVVSIWGLSAGSTPVDTCTLPATYLVDLPTTTSNSTQASAQNPSEPPYVPLNPQIRGMIIYNSQLYVYTSARYDAADGCSGSNLATASSSLVSATITYTSNGPRVLQVGSGLEYMFGPLDGYLGSIMIGSSLAILGSFLIFGDSIAEESTEGGGASH